MRYELQHDTVARLVQTKVSAEALTRRKVERFVQDKYRLYADQGFRLSPDDADYIKPLVGQINIGAVERDFLRQEFRALRRARLSRRALGLLIMLVITALAILFAVKFFQLQSATRTIVRNQVQQISEAILALDFAQAEQTLAAATLLDGEKDTLLPAYLELIYFYTEAGRPTRALDLLAQAAPLTGVESPAPTGTDTLASLAAELRRLGDEDLLRSFAARYYPTFVALPAGTFTMGADSSDTAAEDHELPAHAVTLSAFELAATETTVFQYRLYQAATGVTAEQLREKTPPWAYRGPLPQVKVSWYDAMDYADWLSAKTGATYRLPTEAEWEYAAKTGGREPGYPYAGSEDIIAVAWTAADTVRSPQPVGLKQANAFELYDLSGNVWEWCLDFYTEDYYANSPATDPVNEDLEAFTAVIRGGAFDREAVLARVTERRAYDPDAGAYYNIGFRLAREP
jgi:formylglycine-generating enzyme required for sulfatase activity